MLILVVLEFVLEADCVLVFEFELILVTELLVLDIGVLEPEFVRVVEYDE